MGKINLAGLLLEIGTEEIPSGYFSHILEILSCRKESAVYNLFGSQNIRIDKVSCYSTPRRIIFYAENIPAHQDIAIEGPPKRIAFDNNAKPTKALEVFLQKNKASLEDIEVYQGKEEERIRLIKKGVSNKEILEQLLPKVIASLDFPKVMRWNESGVLFARPIRWVLALFGSQVLKFSIAGVSSSNITCGHRFLGRSRIRVRDAGTYFKALDKNRVVWNNEVRRQKIASFLQKKRWYANSQLFDEVTNLIEYPFFIEGVFKEEYLNLPKEILLASMAKHQRIFCLKDKKGALTNRFVAVINGNYRGRKQIRKHYENVLDARLKDAMFFYKSDTKKTLSKWSEGLSGVVFHKELGTLKDKVERVEKIAMFLTKYIKISDDEKKALKACVSLCKADLLTQMVREFPSLQGTVGSYYAIESGEDKIVAEAIGEHYLPRFADDIIPSTTIGIICSLADKLDNIICYFKIGKFPKGGWDLYALRRQGIGIISVLMKKEIFLSLEKLFGQIYDIAPGGYDKNKLKGIYLDFFRERFISFVKERFDFSYDLVESVTAEGIDDIYNSFLKLKILDSIIDKDYFEKARCIVERTHNIIKASQERDSIKGGEEVDAALFEEEEERLLYNRYKGIKKQFEPLSCDRKYDEATRIYAEALSKELHNFFDKVMVNVEKKNLRLNRLALLSAINGLYIDNIADLSKIVVQNNSK